MPDGTIDPARDYLAELTPNAPDRWRVIAAAKAEAINVQGRLCAALREFTSDDVDVVVFGSLARREWTSGSDVDWTLLIDGQADGEHRAVAREVKGALESANFKMPGGEGIFGNLAFSHEIVHHIGGQADTNRNTTQRILLLLEAAALRESGDPLSGPFERIVRQILSRYLASDSIFHPGEDQESRIPRFLLNDVVRYWRTMCVDFAYKDWEQGGKKWALRNIKLRTSRKMLFVSGLMTAFSCFKNGSLRRDDTADYLLKLQSHLLSFVHSTPLNIVSWALSNIGLTNECRELLDTYDRFLAMLNDSAIREHLAGLDQQAVYQDSSFLQCRELSHQLQSKLTQICFGMDSPLRQFTIE